MIALNWCNNASWDSFRDRETGYAEQEFTPSESYKSIEHVVI